MNPQKILTLVLALGIGPTLGVAFYAKHQRTTVEVACASLRNAPGAERAEIQRLEKTIATTEKQRSSYEQALAQVQTAPKFQPFRARPSNDTLLRRDPKLQALYLRAERSRIARVYGPLLTTLQLTTEQISRFYEIQATHAAERLDLLSAYEAMDETRRKDSAVAAMFRDEKGRFDSALRTLLGDTGIQRLTHYESTVPGRELVRKLAGAVAFTEPLGAERGEQLLQLIIENCPTFQEKNHLMLQNVDYDSIRVRAAEILSPTQLAAWKEVEQEPRWQAVMSNAMAEAHRAFMASEGKSAPK